jgi:hypothetical protein
MRENKLIKVLEETLKKDFIYSSEELIYMKKELKKLKEQLNTNKKLTSKGFGN